MGSISIGTLYGYSTSSNAGRYACSFLYDSVTRDGDYAVINNARVYMERYSSSYTTNRIAICVGIGSTNNVLNNHTINPSGTASGSSYTISLGNIRVRTNGSTIPLYVAIASTGGSSSWNNFQGNSPIVFDGSMEGAAPVRPSLPNSVSIPGAIAPDKIAYISWGAASGGSNGVSGYRFGWSKDGGASWTTADVGNTQNYALDLGAVGFVHGSGLRVAVAAYSTVNGVNIYSDGYIYSGTTQTLFVPPSAPGIVSLPSAAAPDKAILASWAACSGGTNGLAGYELAYSKNGAAWVYIDVASNLLSYNLNSIGFAEGDTIRVAIRSYTIGQGGRYHSAWVYSSTLTLNFVAPSVPRTPTLNLVGTGETIPTATYKAAWVKPSSVGTNDVAGYQVQWLKNGDNLGAAIDVGNVLETNITPAENALLPRRYFSL